MGILTGALSTRAGTRPCLGAQVLHITQSALRPLRQHQLRSFALPNSPDVAHRSAQSSSVIITWRWRTHNGDHRNTNIYKNGAKEAAGHVSSSSEVCRGRFSPDEHPGSTRFFPPFLFTIMWLLSLVAGGGRNALRESEMPVRGF